MCITAAINVYRLFIHYHRAGGWQMCLETMADVRCFETIKAPLTEDAVERQNKIVE